MSEELQRALDLGLDPLRFLLILQNQRAAEETISDGVHWLFGETSDFFDFRLTYDQDNDEYEANYEALDNDPEVIFSIPGISNLTYTSYTLGRYPNERELYEVTFCWDPNRGDLISSLNYLAQEQLNPFGYWLTLPNSYRYTREGYQLQMPLEENGSSSVSSFTPYLPEELKRRIIGYAGPEQERGLRTLLNPSKEYLLEEILEYQFNMAELIDNLEKRREIASLGNRRTLVEQIWAENPQYLYLTEGIESYEYEVKGSLGLTTGAIPLSQAGPRLIQDLTYLYELEAITYSVIDNNAIHPSLLIEDGLLKFSKRLWSYSREISHDCKWYS